MFKFLRLLIVLIPSFVLAQNNNNIGAGYCRDFNGINQGVDLGQAFNNLSLPVTIMAWIKADSRSTINPVFSSSSSFNDYHGVWMHVTNNRLQAGFGDGSGGFTSSARRVKTAFPNFSMNGEWMHVCAVIVSSSDIRLYVNGIDVGGTLGGTAQVLVNNSSGGANIARYQRNANTTVFFDGKVDEVKFFDLGLSVNRIREEMCLKTDINAAGLLGAWDFNDYNPASSPQIALDLTGNNNGTSVGATSSSVSGAAVGDAAVFDYPLSSSNSLRLSVPGIDSIEVSYSSQLQGIQVYRVDSLPFYQTGTSSNLIPGLGHYYGVYSARFNTNYNVDFEVLAPTAMTNTFELAYRDNASITSWSVFNSYLNNGTTRNNRGHHEEYILSYGPCTTPGVLPSSYSACDSLIIQLPAAYGNPLWSDGSTASTRIFTASSGTSITNTLSVTGTDANGCIISDTIQFTVSSAFFTALSDQNFCDSLLINLSAPAQNVLWNDGDTSRQKLFVNSGVYSFSAIDAQSGCPYSDTINLTKINLHQIAASFSNCDSVQINLPSNYSNPQWSDGSTSMSRTFYSNQSNLIVTATDTSGCSLVDTIDVTIIQGNYTPLLDEQFCDSVQISLNGLSNILWSDGSTANSRIFNQSATFWFSATDIQNGCTVLDTINLTRIGQSYLAPQISSCDSVSISLPSNYNNPLWSDGSTASSRTFYQDSTLWLSATDTNGCTIRDTIFFQILDAQFNPIPNQNICDSLRINLNANFSNILWQDGDTNHTKSIHLAGVYSYQALDGNGCFFTDTFNINSRAASYLPNAISACDSVRVTLPNNLSNPLWSDGSTALSRVFFQSGTIQVSALDTSGCESSDTISLNILSPTYIPIPNQETCDSLLIEPDSRLSNIVWFDGNTTSSRYFSESGYYWYNAVDSQNGCAMSDSFRVKVLSLDTNWQSHFQSSPETTYCIGDSVKLWAPADAQVRWPNGSDSSITIFSNKVIRLELENECADTTVFLDYQFYDCACNLHIANAFSPNNDNLNDVIRPKGVCEIEGYHWQIFNRWGNLIFETRDAKATFDGTLNGQNCPEGTYVYKLSVQNKFTTRYYSGTITLIR